ncbi:ABC transporter permease [Bordetella sp. BOR01]|uniref:ABC transporter permease n=1 Tax=Bordetella sp. BOR01 TaxID=2854779 RepID=UPI001C446D53|nr:ABC transporter permease [Bordetella sp. BOR01]MBV7482029.1 ABC transporter permease [Bordetella sp. BOR01]
MSTLARRAAIPVLLVAAWQLAGQSGLIDAQEFSTPWDTLQAFRQMQADDVLLPSLAVSLARASTGLLLGGGLGLVLGLLVGLTRNAENLLDATFQMIRTLPHLALVPLFLIWFGIGEEAKVALVALGSFFPLYLNTFKAIRGIDPRLMELAHIQSLGRWQLIREIVLPGALPGIMVGLRLSIGTAWISLIVAEQMNANSGIGFLTMQARTFGQTAVIMACLVIYASVGLVADLLVRALEQRSSRWQRSNA